MIGGRRNPGSSPASTGGAQLDSAPTFTGALTAATIGVPGTTGAPNPGKFVGVTGTGAPTSGTFAVGDFVVTQNGHMWVCTAAGTPGTWINPRDLSDRLTTGEESMPRELITSAGVTLATGQMRLTYFTARKSETTTQVRVYSGTTAAAATPTLCRIGLYSVASDGSGTLVASTANDTTLFATISTAYTRSWTTPLAKVAGRRYAIGVLVVTAAAAPALAGQTFSVSAELQQAPLMTGAVSSLTDLPSTTTATPAGSGSRVYAALLP